MIHFKNTPQSYGTVAIFLHWLIALFIISLLALGFVMDDLPKNAQGVAYDTHKLIGLSVLILVTIRLWWKSINLKPILTFKQAPWERFAERFVHYSLYLIMILMPLSGLWMSTAAGHLPSVFGHTISFPGVTENKAQAEFFGEVHEFLAWTLIALITIHVLAALKHHFIDRDRVMKGMMSSEG